MVVLYEHPVSPFAQKVKIALVEKGIMFETRLPDLLGGTDDGFSALNPRREVPVLVEGETAIFDSTIILEYLEERWPVPMLMPRTPRARARVRMIEEVCDTYYEAINWAVFEIRFFQRAIGEEAERLLARAADEIRAVDGWLERQLGDHPYFNGDAFGWADIAVVPPVHAASWTGNPPAPGSLLAAWFERVRERASVTVTLEDASRAVPAFEAIPQLVASGQFKREYRDHRLEWMMRNGASEIVLEGLRRGNIRFSAEIG
jgi:glutathione S-transferase